MSKALHNTIIILALVSLVLFIWTVSSLVSFPYGVNYGEAPLIDQAERLLRGAPIYKNDLNEPPYVISNYPPIYIGITAGGAKLTGLTLLQTGRAVSVIAALVSGLILGLLAKRLTGKASAGLLAGIFFLGNPHTMVWSGLARVDILAIMFSLLGIWLICSGKNKWITIGVGGTCLALAVFTRQTSLLAGPVACLVWLWHHDRRQALLLIAWLGAAVVVGFTFLNGVSGGGFYTNIILANVNRFEISRILHGGLQQLQIFPVMIVLGLVKAAQGIMNRIRRGTVASDGHAYLVLSLSFYTAAAFIASLAVGKVGSDVNYYLEFIAACSLWAGVTFTDHELSSKSKQMLVRLAIFVQMVFLLVWSILMSQNIQVSTWQQLDLYKVLEERVRKAAQTGPVLSDDQMYMVLLAGQPIYFQPFEYTQLYAAGLWIPSRLAAEIEEQHFPLILISGDTIAKNDLWPPELISAIQRSYEISHEYNLMICTPKDP